MDTTQSAMPMGQAARLPLSTEDMMGPLPMRTPGAGAPPPQAQGMIGMPPPGQSGAAVNTAGAPAGAPPFDVQMQADGSSLYISKTTPPLVIGVNPPPKLPKALQPDTK